MQHLAAFACECRLGQRAAGGDFPVNEQAHAERARQTSSAALRTRASTKRRGARCGRAGKMPGCSLPDSVILHSCPPSHSLIVAGACRQAPPAPPVSPDTWAVVDGRALTRDEVEKAYRRTAAPNPAASEGETLQAKLQLLDELVLRDILLAKATALKIELPGTELDTAYIEARKNASDEQYQEELKRRNLTTGDMREALRRDLLTQKLLEREVVSKAAASEAEVAEFFEKNRHRSTSKRRAGTWRRSWSPRRDRR